MTDPRPTSDLAADVTTGIFTPPPKNGLERAHDDYDFVLETAKSALDALVARITDLEADRDNWKASCARYLAARQSAEAQVAALADDDAVMNGYRAVRNMLVKRAGSKHDHAEAFRRALRGEEE